MMGLFQPQQPQQQTSGSNVDLNSLLKKLQSAGVLSDGMFVCV
jgi:hypothetical protein